MKEMLESIVAEMLEQKASLAEAVEEFEERFIQTALTRTSGNQSKAAQLLHIHRNTLSRKVAEYRLKRRR